MDQKTENYLQEVMHHLGSLDPKTKLRLKEDLLTQINEASLDQGIDQILAQLGEPKDLARGYLDDLETPLSHVHQFEYRSRATFFGLPLLHVCYRSGRGFQGNVAKGIVAIAPVALGVVAIGPIACGLIAIGAVSLGLLACGALSIGAVLSLGAMAIGYYALGAVAFGYLARGAIAVGETAIGEIARGTNALQSDSLTQEQIEAFLSQHHPGLRSWLIRLFSFGR